MKIFNKFIDIILYIFVAIVLTAAITSSIWNKPMLFSSIKSNSMYPLFERGDIIIISSLSEKNKTSIGDIIVFKAEDGSLSNKGYVVHRIIDGNEEIGYITKGDANESTDQESGSTRIKREWIYSKVLIIGSHPLKIPLIGYLPLWVERFQKNTYAIPIIAVILAVIVGISELTNNKKRKKKKKNGLELQLIYFFSGLTISVVMAATMLATSQRIVLPYEISENTQGVIMGSSVGIIKVGDYRQIPLADLSNKGFMPTTAIITSKDEQISFNNTMVTLNSGDELKIEGKLIASKTGKFETIIHIGMFYPFLPKQLIYNLADISYWLALIVVSLIPGLPLMLFPLIDKTMRRKTIKEIRRKIRRIQNKFQFN